MVSNSIWISNLSESVYTVCLDKNNKLFESSKMCPLKLYNGQSKLYCIKLDGASYHCSLESRGSYTSAHVLFNLLNEFEKIDKMQGLLSILSLFSKGV